MQTHQSPEVAAMLLLCKKVDNELARKVVDYIHNRDQAILHLRLDPRVYSSAHTFAQDYLIVNFLSKWKGFSKWFNIDTKSVALTSWTASEECCRETNISLRSHYGTNFRSFPASYVLNIARRKISEILGELQVAVVLNECEWTSGATADTKYGTPLGTKMSNPLSVTRSALPYLKACVESDPAWSSCFLGRRPDGPCSLLHAYRIRETNRFLTVPKSAKTDRTIAAEPAGNVFLQRGVGKFVRKRLARYGIRLSDQGVNQKMALRAYSERLATLDLRAASDTISIEAVRALIPHDWFEFLNDLRCKSTRSGGVKNFSDVKLEKFSSMGNAFTFELETLIFYALSYAVCVEQKGDPKKVMAYGDDIICESSYSSRLIDVLASFGFTINVEKSFTDGPFYESCGKHYFAGIDVSPVYQKEVVSNLQERIRLYNRIYRWGCAQGSIFSSAVGGSIRYLRREFDISRRSVENGTIPAVPRCIAGDDGYLVDPSWLSNYDCNMGYLCHTYTYRTATGKTRAVDALLAYKLRHPQYTNDDPKGREFEVRKDKGTWVKTKRRIQAWHDDLEGDIASNFANKIEIWRSSSPRWPA